MKRPVTDYTWSSRQDERLRTWSWTVTGPPGVWRGMAADEQAAKTAALAAIEQAKAVGK